MSDTITGVLKKDKRSGFVLRDPKNSFRPGKTTITIPGKLAGRHKLVEGARVTGTLTKTRNGYVMDTIMEVCGLTTEDFARRTPMRDLVVISPDERLRLADSGDMTMRIVDLIAPIGKGTRGLIVSPPKAGKTTILEKLCNAISAAEPGTRVLALLVDERPEEVTHFRRNVQADVFASTNDQPYQEHVELTRMMMAHVQVELECGHDVVVVVDSLTRIGRAFNLMGSGKGRVMSGGMEVGALETPRRFFGMARNIENGGSVTILATALVDTGSRMDELIFQEFKGTGNSEIVLDRQLADLRLFPAISITESGTRREDRLYDEATVSRINRMRGMLAERSPRDALGSLITTLEKYPDNEALLAALPA
ncbi:transcription termination factor Rho [bacterium]|nr:transcription termination factor Rho [bacterium]MBU1073492.1 transcription termination factor Rho [bacterium]MBU1676388.1 transcription termination factor Rho [bacterium]